jgi:hypothetical protein
VQLARLRDPDVVLSETAASVVVREGQGGWALDELTKGLLGKRLLVLYDNVEHLLPRAAEHMAGSSGVPDGDGRGDVTKALVLRGERVFAVPPMSENDGEALFRRRAAEAGAELGTCVRAVPLPRRGARPRAGRDARRGRGQHTRRGRDGPIRTAVVREADVRAGTGALIAATTSL